MWIDLGWFASMLCRPVGTRMHTSPCRAMRSDHAGEAQRAAVQPRLAFIVYYTSYARTHTWEPLQAWHARMPTHMRTVRVRCSPRSEWHCSEWHCTHMR